MTNKVHVLRWLTDPQLMLADEPLMVSQSNWQHEQGEDWSASLSIHYHGYPAISIELCIGREEIGDEIGYVAVVSGNDLEPFHYLFETLHGAMLTAETMAVQLICNRRRELA
ncbi:MAG: hypothetical protein E5Y31_11290 [Mesorhizobium sp.]|nr:MAG: hypothetical protein E5Y31_11290 [Mesorhizobium sp.]